jgi:hypothetical protein
MFERIDGTWGISWNMMGIMLGLLGNIVYNGGLTSNNVYICTRFY